LLALAGSHSFANYPKDTQLNTPFLSRTCDTALRACTGRGLLSLVFFYPIDFVVKHPVAPGFNPVPTLGWVRTDRLSALLKGQHPFGMLSFEQFEFVATGRGTAGPSTALRSGRDDTSVLCLKNRGDSDDRDDTSISMKKWVPMGGWWS